MQRHIPILGYIRSLKSQIHIFSADISVGRHNFANKFYLFPLFDGDSLIGMFGIIGMIKPIVNIGPPFDIEPIEKYLIF